MASVVAGRARLALAGGTPAVTASERSVQWVGGRARRAANDLLDAAAVSESALSDHEGTGVVAEFERAFADLAHAEHAVAASSGTAAIITMLRAAGIGPGDDVVVAAYGWGSTVGAVLGVGATPVFADIDERTACLLAESVGSVLTGRTRAILATHMFGNASDVDALGMLASRRGVLLLFDAAQAMGASVRGRMLGAFGDAAAWSCGLHKLPYVGEGGIVTTNSRAFEEALVVVGPHPSRARRSVLDPSWRSLIDEMTLSLRIHPLAAVIGVAQCRSVRSAIARRRAACERLRRRLAVLPGVCVTAPEDAERCAWYAFAVTFTTEPPCGARAVAAALRAEGVPIEPGPVRVPLHRRPRFTGTGDSRRLPTAEARCRNEWVVCSESRWLGVPVARVDQIADAFEKVLTRPGAYAPIVSHDP